jgi:hypothetical protein
MRQSETSEPAPLRRGLRRSASTADGIAAERLALADRERELERQRRTSRARIAARHLERRPASR